MATTYGDTVNAYYLAYYGRPADPAGLAYWTTVLEKSNGDASSIVSAFAASPEATARFGNESVSDRVSDIYQGLFGRAPDKAGLDYWVSEITAGHVTVATAAIDIMHGAQKADEQTSTLRQQVAAQFTAEVKASGVAYDGVAAIEAARVLIAAVNADSKPADIASLVKAGASLVQTAHDNPDVIKALANGGDLSAVLNTASGKADPVGVVQALASIGKAALTDSAGLNTLLQGGGMSGLLDSLPAGTSVKDVAAAVSNGGLSAGADVAKPPVDVPVDPPVSITPTIAFVGADGKDLPADTTLVANSFWYFIDIHGRPAGANTTIFEVSSTGNANDWKAVSEDVDLADGTYFVRYTIKDAAGNSGTSNALKLVMDHSVPFLNLALAEDTGTSNADRVSSNGAVKISGLHANEAWYYSFDGKTWTSGTTDANGMATIAAPATDGVKNLTVRTLENVDGKSQFTSTALKYTLDKVAPAAPTVALAVDSGTSGTDKITNNSAIKVSGLETGAKWEFSYDKGAHWTLGTSPVVNGTANLDTGAIGAQTVMVRSTDTAGNVSATTSFDYTVQKFLSGLLNVGKIGSDVTLNSKGLNPSVMIAGMSAGTTKVFQVSSTGNADDFHDWHAGDVLADGTYYFRATGADVAGNSYISNVVTVHLDNTAPPAPTGVTLKTDTGIAGDGITTDGNFIVSGLQKDALWEFSSDGTHWFPGQPAAADGTATGYAQATGDQTLQVRTFDLAGNTSEAATLHFNFDNHLPALGLTLNGADPVTHLLQTTAPAPDLVFSYTGTINAGDTFDYTPMFMADGSTVWTKIDASMIDTVNKTITLHNFDLSTGDVFLTLRGSDAAGSIYYQASVDGPYTSTFTQYSASGAQFNLSGQFTANLYLTDGSQAPVKLVTDDASGGLVGGKYVNVGAQTAVVTGVAGAGNDANHLTAPEQGSGKTYAFGTTGGDTLSGTHVWGFGGDDTINATGTDKYNSAMISGGAGADTIHTETSSSQLMYASSAESFLVADDAVAHGFDTVYLSNGVPTSYSDVLNFEDIKLGDFYKPVGAASFSGSETGNALLAALETAVTGSFKTGQSLSQAALVSFGNDGNGHAVNFLVVDADKDGHVGSGDYIVEIVGSIGSSSVSYEHGMVFLNTLSVPV